MKVFTVAAIAVSSMVATSAFAGQFVPPPPPPVPAINFSASGAGAASTGLGGATNLGSTPLAVNQSSSVGVAVVPPAAGCNCVPVPYQATFAAVGAQTITGASSVTNAGTAASGGLSVSYSGPARPVFFWPHW